MNFNAVIRSFYICKEFKLSSPDSNVSILSLLSHQSEIIMILLELDFLFLE